MIQFIGIPVNYLKKSKAYKNCLKSNSRDAFITINEDNIVTNCQQSG